MYDHSNQCVLFTDKFTGKERDFESGLDNFGARYDSSQYGRFMTPDWSAKPQGVPFAILGNPQCLNLYSYVLNNPLRYIDAISSHAWNRSARYCFECVNRYLLHTHTLSQDLARCVDSG
jgi:RHS repeat-associated protein